MIFVTINPYDITVNAQGKKKKSENTESENADAYSKQHHYIIIKYAKVYGPTYGITK